MVLIRFNEDEQERSPSKVAGPPPTAPKASDSGSNICSSSRQSFHICCSKALISAMAVPSWTNIASSAAMLSADEGSVGILGVAARFTDKGVLDPYGGGSVKQI